MKNFTHIHNVLINSGYPESHNSEWYIKIEDYQGCQIIPHWYDCYTKERAKIAVKSLLNKTDVYTVTVYSPMRNPLSFHGYKFTDRDEHEWRYFFD